MKRLIVALAVGGLLAGASAGPGASSAFAVSPPPVDPQAPYTPKVVGLLSQLTLDEKLTLIEGASEPAATNQYQAGYPPGVPRLGIPFLRLADDPPGTGKRQPSVGMTQTMGVAATFSDDAARLNGVVIGRDARALGIDVTLQPFINMLRDPTWSRAFNVFGEDPLLTGQTGAAEIRGIQSQGVMAQAKHYIAYDSGAGTVLVGDEALHEIYLAPFTDAVNAGVASIMCSYNRLGSRENYRFSCDDAQTLTAILRNELGFKGFVTSDLGAIHGLPFINAGVDMEMPGSGLGGLIAPFWTKDAMRAAITDGTVSIGRLNEAVARILYQEERFGLLSGASKHAVAPEPVAADERVVQHTGEQAATLLKNDGNALPLSREDLGSLALIGPGAGQTMGVGGMGERSSGLASYQQIGTYDVLRRRYANDPRVHLTYAVADDMTGTPVPASALSHDGQRGLLRTPKSGGTQVDAQLNFTQSNGNALPAGYGATWTGTLTVPTAGAYWLNIQSLGAAAQLTVDGKALGNTGPGFPGLGPRYGTVKATDCGVLPTTDSLCNARTQVQLSAGAHTIAVTVNPDVSGAPVQVRLNWVTPEQQQANRAQAIAAAKNARTAVVFAWSRGSLATPLPEDQDQLIADIAAANPNTIVVLNNDLPLAMPWLDKTKAVLEMWFPGDTGGYATANVLTGRVNPAGRLPFTWPARLDQGVANQPGQHP